MMKYLAAAAFIVVLGLVGHQDEKAQLFEATVNTCEHSGGATMTATGRQCNNLIKEVSSRYNVEVLSDSDGAEFWIEGK